MLTFLQALFWVETKGKTLEEVDAMFEQPNKSLEQLSMGIFCHYDSMGETQVKDEKASTIL